MTPFRGPFSKSCVLTRISQICLNLADLNGVFDQEGLQKHRPFREYGLCTLSAHYAPVPDMHDMRLHCGYTWDRVLESQMELF